MAVTEQTTSWVTRETYEEFACSESDRRLEWHKGMLREKPAMSFRHSQALHDLYDLIRDQTERTEYLVRMNFSRVYHPGQFSYIPDLLVVPMSLVLAFRDRGEALEAYADPSPLIVEIWSPSTGDYDINEKIPAYQARGDLEIWRIHPGEQSITAWRRQPDGTYSKTVHREGSISISSLSGVAVDLDVLFAGPFSPPSREE